MSDTVWMMDQAVTSLPLFSGLVLLWAGFAIGNGFLAKRLGHSVALWVILSLIPIVNYFFYFFVIYATVLGILKRLNTISDHLAVTGSQTT
ncbi:MAG: hypothetical protein KGJ66_04750 [Alphaproteobacteria bacterium]|nr:hypothetical protein [Alphaproteobacteria bacterium]